MAVKKLKESSSRSTFNYSGYSFEEVVNSYDGMWWVSIVPEDFDEDYEAYSEDGEDWLILKNGDEVGQERSDDRKEVADILIQYAGLEEGVKSKMAVKKLKESVLSDIYKEVRGRYPELKYSLNKYSKNIGLISISGFDNSDERIDRIDRFVRHLADKNGVELSTISGPDGVWGKNKNLTYTFSNRKTESLKERIEESSRVSSTSELMDELKRIVKKYNHMELTADLECRVVDDRKGRRLQLAQVFGENLIKEGYSDWTVSTSEIMDAINSLEELVEMMDDAGIDSIHASSNTYGLGQHFIGFPGGFINYHDVYSYVGGDEDEEYYDDDEDVDEGWH